MKCGIHLYICYAQTILQLSTKLYICYAQTILQLSTKLSRHPKTMEYLNLSKNDYKHINKKIVLQLMFTRITNIETRRFEGTLRFYL